jgi:aminopeptidase
MLDARKFARLLCEWCLEPQPGDQVVIASSTLAADAVLALQTEVLERDAYPILRISLPGQEENFWAAARGRHLDRHAPMDLLEAQTTQRSIRIDAPSNTRALANVDPARLARAARARARVREAALERRWCLTMWPTAALAQSAAMGTREYADFLGRALFLDQDDPVAAWKALSARQATLVDRLTGAEEIRIEAEGTDLTLRVGGRTWVNSDGRRNMPSGEVFTGPVEDSAEGKIRFTVPTAPGGVEVAGVELTFREGRVVESTAERGQEYLRTMLAADPGASLLGELGIGTNRGIDRATGTILLDEKIGGTVHLAIGRSYPETGGVNESSVHWDMICDLRGGGRILADGEPVEIP